MKEQRRETTVRQLEVLLEFLERNRELALGRVRSKEARVVSARLWCECAETLNSLGPARTGKEWAKVWNDLNCRVRAKLVAINASLQATGAGPSNAPDLSPLEEKVANIIGRDVGPLPNVRQDQFAGAGNDVVEEVVEVMEHPTNETQNSPPIVINVPYEELRSQPSPAPSLSRQAPSPQAQSESRSGVIRPRERRRAGRVARHATATIQAQAPQATSSRTALEESRSMGLRIEEMRAQAALSNSQAALNNSQAMTLIAESLRMIAESVDRMSRQYCSSQNQGGSQS